MDTTYRKKRKIGSGGHGNVYKVKESSGKYSAMKITTEDDVHTSRELTAMRVLSDAAHPHVITYTRSPYRDAAGHVFQHFELCECDLLTFMEQNNIIISEVSLRVVFLQVLEGLKHCHSHGVFHLDIKPENILKTKSCFKIADFGSSRVMQQVGASETGNLDAASPAASPVSPIRVVPGTVLYAAPETFAADMVTSGEKLDVWALAITIFVSLTGFFPWEESTDADEHFVKWNDIYDGHASEDERLAAASEYIRVSIPVEVSPPLRDLFARMLHVDPARRASLEDVRAHAWFSSLPM